MWRCELYTVFEEMALGNLNCPFLVGVSISVTVCLLATSSRFFYSR